MYHISFFEESCLGCCADDPDGVAAGASSDCPTLMGAVDANPAWNCDTDMNEINGAPAGMYTVKSVCPVSFFCQIL